MKIKLNNNFYDKEVIKEAVGDFKGVCNIQILNDNIEIELKSIEENENLGEEFCNYVLGLMKNKILV
tara:strand:+ start:432 stop:632 length:201 start_codon:yes stop_codon:yes gene_type:complete